MKDEKQDRRLNQCFKQLYGCSFSGVNIEGGTIKNTQEYTCKPKILPDILFLNVEGNFDANRKPGQNKATRLIYEDTLNISSLMSQPHKQENDYVLYAVISKLLSKTPSYRSFINCSSDCRNPYWVQFFQPDKKEFRWVRISSADKALSFGT